MIKLLFVLWRNLCPYVLSYRPPSLPPPLPQTHPRLETYWMPRLLIMETCGLPETLSILAESAANKEQTCIKVGKV